MWVIKRLYQFVLQQPFTFWMGSFFMASGMILNNVAPFFVKWLTQSVQAEQLEAAFWLILWLGAALIISNFLENFGYFVTDKNMVGTSTRLSQAVLTHIHNLDFAYHTNKSSGKLISLMKRGDEAFFTFYDVLNRQFLNIILSFLVMFGAFSQLQLHYILFLIGVMVLSVAISFILVKENIKKRNIYNAIDDDLASVRVDNLVNFDTVKYFAREKYEQHRFANLLQKWDDALQGYFFTFRYFDLFLGNLINCALVGIMLLALWDVQRGALSLPEFLLVTTFSMTLLPRMMNFLFNLRDLAKKYSDFDAYLKLLEEKISVADPIAPKILPVGHGEINFDDVTFTYGNSDTPVLKHFKLQIKAGESIALVGYSGAGKTTIAKLLMRMYDTQSGKITVNGVDIRELTKQVLRSRIGIVPQDPLLFNNTIYYNIAYARDTATKAEIIAASEAAKVSDFVKKLTDGYETVVGERGIKLSGGQRQRLAIARVLLEQPEILILDEATSALDSASEQTIQTAFWDLVRNAEQPRTAIIIAHRLSTIMKADRIVVMDKGSIVDVGTHAELIQKGQGIYHQLWSLQRNGFIGDGETEESSDAVQ
jgi:ABC-type multidrug transport system fused ATPase/permease subunit